MIHGISPKIDNSSFAMGTPGFLAYAFLAQLLKEETDEFWIRLFSVFSKLMFQDLCCRRDYLRQSMNIHAIELAAGDIQSVKTEDDKISLNPVVLSQIGKASCRERVWQYV